MSIITISPSTNPPLDLIEVLDLLISDLFFNFSENSLVQSIPNSSLKDSMFYLMKTRPNISLKDYLARFRNFTNCSNQIFLIAFIYFDRIVQKSRFMLQKLNIHK